MGRRHLPIAAIVSGLFAAGAAAAASQAYPIVGTGQVSCFDNAYEIACPQPGRGFYGQDAQFPARRPSYTLSQSGLTVVDNLTGLTWQRSPETNNDGSLDRRDKLTLSQAQKRPAELNAIRYGGYSDWRLPTIKELYSLITFNGRDPAPTAAGSSGLIPFIDTRYFHFAYGQPNTGERVIDSQYASSTLFANPSWQGVSKMFGVNFADGRIKGYDLTMPGGAETGFFVLCVRGNENYGKNDFLRNGDGTITDRATGLMWARADSGKSMNWSEALAWTQSMNRQNYLGHRDWRLPNAKELQSLVDYSRTPDASNSPAIDPLFEVTPVTNETGERDYPFYWSSTTHINANNVGMSAIYIAFGRAMGYMRGGWRDVHGAGSQRSDPKTGNSADFPYGRGPQGDAIRISNFVRLVRDGSS